MIPQVTRKEVKSRFDKVIKAGHCALQYLFEFEHRIAFTANRYGWASDIYDLSRFGMGSIAISTGYASFGNVEPSYGLLEKYDTAAKKVRFDYSLSLEERKVKITELIEQFLEEVIA